MMDYGMRFDAKRSSGISERRRDGSLRNRRTDEEAGAAEEFAAISFNRTPNTTVFTKIGDGGHDFKIKGKTVEVIHLGIHKSSGVPRESGHLIVNPHEPRRHADIYIVVRGSIATGFEFSGFATHKELLEHPKKDFGYGLRFCMSTEQLRPINQLFEFALL